MKIAGIVLLLCIILSVVTPFVTYLSWRAQADRDYGEKFGSYVTMAYDEATFEGIRKNVMDFWHEMNVTFAGFDYVHTYNTWWWPSQIKENSLYMQNRYLYNLVFRLNETIKEKDQILAGNKTVLIPYTQWYQTGLNQTRAEMKREGGLDWVVAPAWMLSFAPMAYWWFLYQILIWIVLIVVGFFALIYLGIDW